jgi:hypothetical protein
MEQARQVQVEAAEKDLRDQLREAEDDLDFVQRMHIQYRIPQRVCDALLKVAHLRAAVAAATGARA